MNFELKKADTVGGVKEKDAKTSSIFLNITVGVVGCPYSDIKTTKTVAYDFSNALTITQAKDGIETFATTWVAANYPNT